MSQIMAGWVGYAGVLLSLLLAPQLAVAAGLRIPVSAFGVAAPDYGAYAAMDEDGDLTTRGRSKLRYALLDQADMQAGLGVSTWWDDRHGTGDLFIEHSYVPLLHAFGEYRFWRSFRIGGDIDAFGGAQGHDIDAGMRLSYELSPAWSISAAYRLYREGDEVRFDPVEQGRVSFGTHWRF